MLAPLHSCIASQLESCYFVDTNKQVWEKQTMKLYLLEVLKPQNDAGKGKKILHCSMYNNKANEHLQEQRKKSSPHLSKNSIFQSNFLLDDPVEDIHEENGGVMLDKLRVKRARGF